MFDWFKTWLLRREANYISKDVVIFWPAVILNPKNLTILGPSRVDSYVKIESGEGVSIGRYTHISSFAHINIGGGKLVVGEGVALAAGCKVFSGTNTPEGQAMSSAAPKKMQIVKRYTTRIGNYAHIGAGSIVMPGVSIGEYAVVGAGAVATKDVPDGAIVVGNPAKILRYRTDMPIKVPNTELEFEKEWGKPGTTFYGALG